MASFDWSTFNGDPKTLPAAAQALYAQTVRGNEVLVQSSPMSTAVS